MTLDPVPFTASARLPAAVGSLTMPARVALPLPASVKVCVAAVGAVPVTVPFTVKRLLEALVQVWFAPLPPTMSGTLTVKGFAAAGDDVDAVAGGVAGVIEPSLAVIRVGKRR